MEKYRELFNLSKEVLNEELNRYQRLDEKASKYLSALTVLIGIHALFLSQLFSRFFPPERLLDWLLAMALFLLFLLTIRSWYLVLKALRIAYLSKTPLDLQFFRENLLINIYYAMARTNEQALRANRTVNDRKSKLLAKGYRAMCGTMLLSVTFFFLFALYACSTKSAEYNEATEPCKNHVNRGAILMDQQQEQPDPQTTPDPSPPKPAEPDDAIEPLPPDIVTEGCNNPVEKRSNNE